MMRVTFGLLLFSQRNLKHADWEWEWKEEISGLRKKYKCELFAKRMEEWVDQGNAGFLGTPGIHLRLLVLNLLWNQSAWFFKLSHYIQLGRYRADEMLDLMKGWNFASQLSKERKGEQSRRVSISNKEFFVVFFFMNHGL